MLRVNLHDRLSPRTRPTPGAIRSRCTQVTRGPSNKWLKRTPPSVTPPAGRRAGVAPPCGGAA